MNYPAYEDVNKVNEILNELAASHWYHDDFLTMNWWILCFATLIPWVIWYIYRDKKRTFEILSYGLIWVVFAFILDEIGRNLILWSYPDNLLPQVEHLLPADFSIIPVSFMFVYQFTKSMKTYILGSAATSVIIAYIVEHLFEKRGMIVLHNWSHTSTFVGFILLSFLIKGIIVMLKSSSRGS